MSTSLYYTAVRAAPLTDAEQLAVRQVVQSTSVGTPVGAEGLHLYDNPVDGAVLDGSSKLPSAEDQALPALVHLLGAVTELRSAVPDADWSFTLDDLPIDWDDHRGYSLPGL